MRNFRSETKFNEWANATKMRQAFFGLFAVFAVCMTLAVFALSFTDYSVVGILLYVGSAGSAAYFAGMSVILKSES